MMIALWMFWAVALVTLIQRLIEFLLGNKNADMVAVFAHEPAAQAELRAALEASVRAAAAAVPGVAEVRVERLARALASERANDARAHALLGRAAWPTDARAS